MIHIEKAILGSDWAWLYERTLALYGHKNNTRSETLMGRFHLIYMIYKLAITQ